MAKPTSLASHIKREDEAALREQDKENEAVASRPASEGKVWVRLLRAHYDSNGFLHLPGIVELFATAVPSSAKVLTAAQATAQLAEEDE